MELDPNSTSLLVYVVAAIAYAFIGYLSQRTKYNGRSQPFKPWRVVRTVLAGVLVGLVAYTQGIVLTLQNYEQVAAAIGATAIADELLKSIGRPAVMWGLERVNPDEIADTLWRHVTEFVSETPANAQEELRHRKRNGQAPPGVDVSDLEPVDADDLDTYPRDDIDVDYQAPAADDPEDSDAE